MLDQNLVAEVLHTARGGGAQWADLFMEDTITGALHLLDGRVKDATGATITAWVCGPCMARKSFTPSRTIAREKVC